MQALQKAVPQDFELMGQKKGFVRYMNPALRALVKKHADALETRETALTGILQVTVYTLNSMHDSCNHNSSPSILISSNVELLSLLTCLNRLVTLSGLFLSLHEPRVDAVCGC